MEYAVFEVEGTPYNVLYMRLEAHQEVDEVGRPSTPVQDGHVYLELEWVTDDELFLKWATEASEQHNAEIRLFGTKGKVKTIAIENAWCVDFRERFQDPSQNLLTFFGRTRQVQNYITCLTLTAETIAVRDVKLTNA